MADVMRDLNTEVVDETLQCPGLPSNFQVQNLVQLLWTKPDDDVTAFPSATENVKRSVSRIQRITDYKTGRERLWFRVGKVCAGHVVGGMIMELFARQKKVCSAFKDIQEAYDTISCEAVWCVPIFKIQGVSEMLPNGFNTFYRDTNACIKIKEIGESFMEV